MKFDIILTEEFVYHIRVEAKDRKQAEEWAQHKGWDFITKNAVEPSNSDNADIRVEDVEVSGKTATDLYPVDADIKDGDGSPWW
jgi:hypothetical protein